MIAKNFILLFAFLYASNGQEVYPIHEDTGKEPIYIGLIVSFGSAQDSSGIIPAVQVALDIINNSTRSSLLDGYSLHYVLYDSQCNRLTALENFFSLILSSKYATLALLGSGCSLATAATAEITHFYNLTQVSCVSNADELSDSKQFQLYYQMLPSEVVAAHAFSAIIDNFQWRKVAILVQNEHSYINISLNLKSLLIQASNNEIEVDIILLQPRESLETFTEDDIFKPGFRIFVLLMNSYLANTVICEAFYQMMSYPKYLFLTYLKDESEWWIQERNGISYNCSVSERARVLDHALVVSSFQRISDDHSKQELAQKATDVGMTRREYIEAYTSKLKESTRYSHNQLSEYCFDATWSIALAINDTIKGTSSERRMRQPLNLNSAAFNGLTGPIEFNSDGIRQVQDFEIFQYRTKKNSGTNSLIETLVATVECVNETVNCTFIYMDGMNDTVAWKFGVPYDGIPVVEVITTHVGLSVIYIIVCTGGIIFAVICFIFNFMFRTKKLIRLTSPNLNYIMCIGAIIVYSSTIIYFVLPTRSASAAYILCTIRTATLAIGYSLTFLTILAKLGRIYYIFRLAKNKVAIKDKHLLIFIIAAVSVPAGLSLAWVIFRSLNYVVTLTTYAERPTSEDGVLGIVTHYMYYHCSTATWDIVYAVIAWSNVFVLKISALWLSFQIRKVKIKGLNESKYVVAIVYISSIFVIINFILSLTIQMYFTILQVLYGTLDIVNITTIISISFVPKMVSLYRDPDGEGIFHQQTVTNAVNNTLHVSQHRPEEVEELKTKVMALERTIKLLEEQNGVVEYGVIES